MASTSSACAARMFRGSIICSLLTYRMLQDDTDFLCVFDASAPAAIREFQGSVFSKFYDYLIQSHPRRFSQVPSGTIADEFILDIATMFGQQVITNDLYRDHVARHPWLETQREQRLSRVALKYSPKLHREVLFWRDCKIMPRAPTRSARFSRATKTSCRIAIRAVLRIYAGKTAHAPSAQTIRGSFRLLARISAPRPSGNAACGVVLPHTGIFAAMTWVHRCRGSTASGGCSQAPLAHRFLACQCRPEVSNCSQNKSIPQASAYCRGRRG